jgi:para-nitrobenzyl esterase
MNTTVETTAGRVRGVDHRSHLSFLGIPFAAPPVGALRFCPPQPAVPWAGVRAADRPGPWAPQNETLLAARVGGEDRGQDEDCLTLNIWTPAADSARRPVMVWVHGGGFVTGSGAGHLYQGDRLAAYDTVVVTINYRLGVLGFAAGEALRDDESGAAGNWGLLDQVAALRWVRDNIGSFGGDPDNVTIFGESAGSMSVTSLCGMPAAAGLFRRAIGQSGGPTVGTLEASERSGHALLADLGLARDPRGLAALRDVPVDRLLAAQAQVSAAHRITQGLPFSPTVDHGVLPRPPTAAVRAGAARDVEVIVGTNLDEVTLFAIGDRAAFALDDARLRRRLGRVLGDDADGAIEVYAKARTVRGEAVTPTALWFAIVTDLVFRVPVLRFAEAQAAHQPNTFSYLFTWTSPVLGGILGSPHALEIAFVFGTLDQPPFTAFTGADQDPAAAGLSTAMMQRWTSFARTGHPDATWPGYESSRRATMIFDRDCSIRDAPMDEERRFWEGVGERVG